MAWYKCIYTPIILSKRWALKPCLLYVHIATSLVVWHLWAQTQDSGPDPRHRTNPTIHPVFREQWMVAPMD